MSGQELQECHDWAKAIRGWNLQIRRHMLQECHDTAGAPGVTRLGKSSRSDISGKEHQG